ncbi:MAG: FAD-binding oxidoreductase [Candidatus Kapabacteria bacterium]|nr:FAD-binding oxidoreductase [Candidatus Kapabacteria bacterium]
MENKYQSWGRTSEASKHAVKLFWRDEIPDLNSFSESLLPYGYGKSYGDSCLNAKGSLLITTAMNKIISFDATSGIIRCEAGISLAQLLDFLVPRGFFLASTPGTKFITVGGAIANDVHGKNHHRMGTFGTNLIKFELLRSDGKRYICSETENIELYRTTIGGLGLTGLILWAEFKTRPCKSPFIAMESIKFESLEEFFEISAESDTEFEYTVSWLDCGSSMGRGLFSRGNHADPANHNLPKKVKTGTLPAPPEFSFINPYSVNAFNILYYNIQTEKKVEKIIDYNPFFYPLDAVSNWNLAYGKHGFFQYQFVLPFENVLFHLKNILNKVANSGMSSFLTVLKTFGDKKSPGLLSFPRPGVTMAIDFRNDGSKTLEFLNSLDKLVNDSGGVLYPAKDSRMSADNFKLYYPQWEQFSGYIDPKFSSDFWKRVI